MLADLHTHSTYSDGKYTPKQLVEAAVASNIGFLALTDHDSWNGVNEALRAAEPYKDRLKVIPGVELGTQLQENSIHILGYYINMNYQPLHEKMNEMRFARERRLYKMLDKLHQLGYDITVEACDPQNRSVGRPHVAKALVAAGYFSGVQEVFDSLLKRGAPAYVPQPKLLPNEAISLLHQAGGLAVLAHPSEIGDKKLAESLLQEYDFDAIEVYHPSADKNEQQYWQELAKKYHLMISGGSDFHGIPDRFPAKLGLFQVEAESISDIINHR